MNHQVKKSQAGQVGVIVLLMMVVILAVAISLSQRTMQEQDIAIVQEESTRVFNAAESGIEEALFNIKQAEREQSPLVSEGSFEFEDIDSNFKIESTYNIDQADIVDIFLDSGRAIEIPLTSAAADINIHWWHQSEGCPAPAALIIAVFSDTNVTHLAFDPCERGNFARVNQGSYEFTNNENEYRYQAIISTSDNDRFLRIKPIFNHTAIYVTSNEFDKVQYNVNADAYSDEEDVARSLEVNRSMPGSPDFMDFTLVSGNTLTK